MLHLLNFIAIMCLQCSRLPMYTRAIQAPHSTACQQDFRRKVSQIVRIGLGNLWQLPIILSTLEQAICSLYRDMGKQPGLVKVRVLPCTGCVPKYILSHRPQRTSGGSCMYIISAAELKRDKIRTEII